MNIFLAELLNSIPPEFSVKKRKEKSILLHFKNKEIYIAWFYNGRPCKIVYSENGVWHRPSSEGPAHQAWFNTGQPSEMSYWNQDLLHRPSSEGPARWTWNEDGSLYSEEYWQDGMPIKERT